MRAVTFAPLLGSLASRLPSCVDASSLFLLRLCVFVLPPSLPLPAPNRPLLFIVSRRTRIVCEPSRRLAICLRYADLPFHRFVLRPVWVRRLPARPPWVSVRVCVCVRAADRPVRRAGRTLAVPRPRGTIPLATLTAPVRAVLFLRGPPLFPRVGTRAGPPPPLLRRLAFFFFLFSLPPIGPKERRQTSGRLSRTRLLHGAPTVQRGLVFRVSAAAATPKVRSQTEYLHECSGTVSNSYAYYI